MDASLYLDRVQLYKLDALRLTNQPISLPPSALSDIKSSSVVSINKTSSDSTVISPHVKLSNSVEQPASLKSSQLFTDPITPFCCYWNTTDGCKRGLSCKRQHRKPKSADEIANFKIFLKNRANFSTPLTMIKGTC